MEIRNSVLEDKDIIRDFCAAASDFQKSKSTVSWPLFDPKLIEHEIREKRQWKMMVGDEVVCIWAITDSDPQIWGDRNAEPALYLHRIATNPNFRGRNLVLDIVVWAKRYAKNQKPSVHPYGYRWRELRLDSSTTRNVDLTFWAYLN